MQPLARWRSCGNTLKKRKKKKGKKKTWGVRNPVTYREVVETCSQDTHNCKPQILMREKERKRAEKREGDELSLKCFFIR